MLSYISMKGLRDENYIALGGVSPLALDTFLKECGAEIQNVNLCLDNDDAGIVAADLIKESLLRKGKYAVTRELPAGKDFNEDLQRLRSAERSRETEADSLIDE